MNRRERLMATLRGEPVDRPPVSFYEINGLYQKADDPDPFNIYSHPSWKPMLDLTREKTDLIVMRSVWFKDSPPDPAAPITQTQESIQNGSRITVQTLKVGRRTLSSRTRRDPDVNTVWTVEHLLKDTDDLKAYLQIPPREFGGTPDPSGVLEAEAALGDSGIVMLGGSGPLCSAAPLFSMADYTVAALTEQKLFHRLLDRFAEVIYARTEAVAKALPGRLWRVVGSEYASPPYLPPALYREYIVRYDQPIVDSIRRYGGFARVHSHGNLKAILDDIASMGVDGLDPIEPPPQGDVELAYVREKYGRQMVLFGNLEVSDIETLPTPRFAEKVQRALDEGTAGEGRGFVLMPSACPYGRVLSDLSLRNYEEIVRQVERFARRNA